MDFFAIRLANDAFVVMFVCIECSFGFVCLLI